MTFHAYLFVSDEPFISQRLAMIFSEELLGLDRKGLRRSSDFFLLKKAKGKKNISILDIRLLKKALSLHAVGRERVVIIKRADELSSEAAASLLKILEEPKGKMVFVLTTSSLDKIPETVISRCQKIRISSPSKNFYDQKLKLTGNKNSALISAVLSDKNLKKRVTFFRSDEEDVRIATKKFKYLKNSYRMFFKDSFWRKSKNINDLVEKKGELSSLIDFSLVRLTVRLIKNIKSNQRLKAKKILKKIIVLTETKDLLKKNVDVKLLIENLFLYF